MVHVEKGREEEEGGYVESCWRRESGDTDDKGMDVGWTKSMDKFFSLDRAGFG
jgi:hypothetical protein